MRDRDIKWVTNAKIDRVNADSVEATELNEDGSVKKTHKIATKFTMLLPAFRGVDCLKDEDGKWIDGLTNPRGFITVDRKQRNAKYPNIFAVGVCVALPPFEPTPVPVGMPKTGYMIESMCTAAAQNIRDLVAGKEPRMRAPGTPCASPTSAIMASPSSRNRKSRRVTSTGRPRAIGCISPRWP